VDSASAGATSIRRATGRLRCDARLTDAGRTVNNVGVQFGREFRVHHPG
jgi:hypothetical protein